MTNSLGFPIDSFGYEGTIAANDVWARVQSIIGARYTVAGATAAQVTAVSAGTREVKIAAGSLGGHGILDEITADITLQLPVVASGTEWFLIIAKRTWGLTQATSIDYVPAGTAPVIPTRVTDPGVEDDQPLALVSLTAGSSVPGTPIDLRVVGSDRSGGLIAFDELALSYFNEPGSVVQIGNSLWTRILDSGYVEKWDRVTLKKLSQDVIASSNYTVPTSTSVYSNIPGLTFDFPVVDSAQVFQVVVSLACAARTSAGQLLAALSVDGSSTGERMTYEGTNGTELTITRTWRLTGLSPGSHTLRVTGRSAYGSVEVLSNSSALQIWEN